MAAAEPIRDKAQFRALADYFYQRGEFRHYALIVVGTYTALRISDLLNLQWTDVYDEGRGAFMEHINLTEKKTGKRKLIALNDNAVKALSIYFPYRHGNYIFASKKSDKPISRIQAWRIIRDAASAVGVSGNISCHSLRKTWGYHAWASSNVSPVVIMDVYNHSDYNTTKRYLGITQNDLDRAYLDLEIL